MDATIFVSMKAEISLSFTQLMELALGLPEVQRKKLAKALTSPVRTEPSRLRASDFSFQKTREQLKDLDITISDALIEERRSAL